MRSLYVLPCAVWLRYDASDADDLYPLHQEEEVEEEKKSKKKAATKKRSAKKQPDSDEEDEEEEEVSSPFFGSPYRGPAHTHTHALLDCLVQAKPKKTKKAPAKKRAAKKDAESDEAEEEVRRIPLMQSIPRSTRLTQLAVHSRRRSRRRGADASRPPRSRKLKRSRTKSRFKEWSLRALPFPSLARPCRVLMLDTQLCEAL